LTYRSLFAASPVLFADQYALTMAAADFAAGQTERQSVFQVFFRDLIPNGFKDSDGRDLRIPYLVAAGLGPFFEWFDAWRVADADAAYLASLKGGDGDRLFSDPFLRFLQATKFKIDIDAFPEGELVFPDEPLVRLSGPHWQIQLLEAALLNAITAHTGWATVASQFWLASQRLDKKAKLSEFGARRTPEWGGLGTARSSYLAGWDGTSNLYAGEVYGIPTAGTMAHSFVMVRESEIEAFALWARHMPQLCVFLVDTYDTAEGVLNAIKVAKKTGVKLRGVRIDSGDIDYLSRMSREALDAAGFYDAAVMASDGLTLTAIHQAFQTKNAPLDAFGIGGSYVSRRQDSAGVAAVMKVAATDGRDVMKYSDSPEKATLPGVLDVIRYEETDEDGQTFFAGDTILPLGAEVGASHLTREVLSVGNRFSTRVKPFPEGASFYRPVVPVMRDGQHLIPSMVAKDAKNVLSEARARFFVSMAKLRSEHKQIISPRLYIAGVEEGLMQVKNEKLREKEVVAQRSLQAKRFGRTKGKK
jgi:nicotinate phosphoribosyltransferase